MALEWWRALPIGIQAAVMAAVIAGSLGLLGWRVSYRLGGVRAKRDQKTRWIRAALEWRTSEGASTLRGADLERADLHGLSLCPYGPAGADLSFANLRCADLTHSDLSLAVLTAANLRRANLGYSVLSSAVLTHADLTKADLRDTYLSGARFWGAVLAKADLRGADLTGARYLEHANLRGTRYDDATTWPEAFIPPRGAKRRR